MIKEVIFKRDSLEVKLFADSWPLYAQGHMKASCPSGRRRLRARVSAPEGEAARTDEAFAGLVVEDSSLFGPEDRRVGQQWRSVTQARWIGTAKLRFSPPPLRRTPTTFPCWSIAGPPELPGLAAASVWMAS